MRYTEPGYSRNDFGVISRNQCPAEDKFVSRKPPVIVAVPSQNRNQRSATVNLPAPLIPMINNHENIEEVEDIDWERLRAEEEATAKLVKPCPWCNKPTYLIDGCNYMKCSEADPPSNCPGEWCFQCLKPKYHPIPGKESLGCCNETSHNSH